MKEGARVGYFFDFDLMTFDGGASFNDREKVKYALRNGFDVDVITPQNVSMRNPKNYDLLVFSNCVGFNPKTLLDWASTTPTIFYHKDYYFCAHRLFAPLQDKCKDCVNRERWLPIFMKSIGHVFLSPLHREAILHTFPELAVYRNSCVPSSVDTNKFKIIKEIPRVPNSVIGINVLEAFKGRYNTYDYTLLHPELRFTFVGHAPPCTSPNCTYLPNIPNDDLPRVLNSFEYILHLPSQTEPFGRTTIEGMLCGCKVITNENNGAFSYPFMNTTNLKTVRDTLRCASKAFWEEVEIIMNAHEKKLKEAST